MRHDQINLADASVNVELKVGGESHWVPGVPYPLFTAKGLPFWKRFNEKHWRPQCSCGQIFDTLDDYNAHVVFWNSIYGKALLEARGQ